jgi:uncharacterized damage-inducible protein DinB
MDELLARGIKSVPVTIWDDHVVIGFNPTALARLFNLSDAVPVADVPTMLAKYEIVLTAACRAFRQLPADRWDWESPERKRTLGQFCFHLSDRPDRALNAYLVGVYTNEDRGREVQHVLRDVGFEAVARNVEAVLRRVTAALSGPTGINLDKRLETYMGDKTAGEMMDLALGHSVHHLKQLYAYMGMMGLEPVAPLRAEDFAGIAVPTELF